MTKIWILLKIQLLNFFGVNKMLHTKDIKEKQKFIFFAISATIGLVGCSLLSYLYSNSMASAFVMLGDIGMLLPIMLVSTSAMVLFTTIYKVSGILFGYKDYDMIIALPVTVRQIVGSRILLLYSMNIVFTFLIMVPAGAVFAIHTAPGLAFYLIFILTILLIPLVPIIIATVIGAIITMIAAKFKHISFISIILSLAFLFGIMYLSMNSSKVTEAQIIDMAKSLSEKIYRVYPLSKLFSEALVDYNLNSLLLYVLISLGSFIIFTMFISINYRAINTLLTTTRSKSNYKMKALVSSSQFGALYKREIKRYFNSSFYVMNTSIGMIMLLILSITFLVVGAGPLEQILEMPGFAELITKAAPLVVSVFLGMSCTTGSSISLEGKHIWIAKSIPVHAITIFLSKIAVNLTLTVPVILVSSTLLIIKLHPSLFEIIMLYITPLVYAVFSATVGIIINLLFPILEWKSEVTVLKQSIASILSMLVGLASVAIPIMIAIFLKDISISFIVLGTTVIIALINMAMYGYLKTKGEIKFRAL
ncbi:MAG: hypothetical protein K0R15_857 [Clostridiales bacterium]|jgi:ABC-2 type transport system permease protein|nr:hypothetical protein [Clostridiales bacterium]